MLYVNYSALFSYLFLFPIHGILGRPKHKWCLGNNQGNDLVLKNGFLISIETELGLNV